MAGFPSAYVCFVFDTGLFVVVLDYPIICLMRSRHSVSMLTILSCLMVMLHAHKPMPAPPASRAESALLIPGLGRSCRFPAVLRAYLLMSPTVLRAYPLMFSAVLHA
jgi:hypothetical protein